LILGRSRNTTIFSVEAADVEQPDLIQLQLSRIPSPHNPRQA
jgi:hypothetical protein